jgi:hypothetical protein
MIEHENRHGGFPMLPSICGGHEEGSFDGLMLGLDWVANS